MRPKQRRVPNHQLQHARLERGWSQEQVAEWLGTSAFTVSRWERGSAIPRPYFRQRLSTLFGLPPERLGLVANHEGPVTTEPLSLPADLATGVASAVTAPQASLLVLPPLLLPRLVGREAILRHLKIRLLTEEPGAPCVLHGLPGVGKTALAVALAHDPDLLAHYSDGVLWAGLGRTPPLREVLSRWASLLGLAPATLARLQTIQDWSMAVHAAIGSRRMLLVIDDAWTIEEALACQVGGHNCVHLLTTRSAEVALQFAGTGTIRVPELNPAAGERLLAQLAPDAVAMEPEAATQLVQAAGGLPLALVLMGRYLHIEAYHQQPRRLRAALERLQQASERLHLDQPLAPAVQPSSLSPGMSLSLAASIDLSYQALTPSVQSLLVALTTFPAKPSTFSEEAALAVATASPDQLDTLLNAGLLESGGSGRYLLHQTIADFAALQQPDPQAKKRFAAFFVHYAETHVDDAPALEPEVRNILAALHLAADQGYAPELIRGATAIAPFFLARGLYDSAEEYLFQAESTARSRGDLAELVTILLYLGQTIEQQGDYLRAHALVQEGMQLARQHGDAAHLCELLRLMGIVADHLGKLHETGAAYQEGLTLARAAGDPKQIILFLRALSAFVGKRGQYAQAAAYLQEGITLARLTGHHNLLATLLANSAVLACECGDYAQAEAENRESLAWLRVLGRQEQVCLVLANLGDVLMRCGRLSEARTMLEEGITLARQMGQRERLWILLDNLGEVLARYGEDQEAATAIEESLTLARQLHYRRAISISLISWGQLQLRRQHLEEAHTAFTEALEIAHAEQDQVRQRDAWFGLAQVAVAQGDLSRAWQQGQAGLRLFERMGDSRAEGIKRWLEHLPEPRDEQNKDWPLEERAQRNGRLHHDRGPMEALER